VFILNFIPNIGSFLATIFPALLALVQFDTLTPFLIIVSGITAIQITVGNFIEPNLMGRSLNISPLIVILSLVIWGTIWGIPGMFLCVPITVIVMIILNRFEGSRWIALALSKTGQITTA
jgi:predicted PurR-regulated permease PerM